MKYIPVKPWIGLLLIIIVVGYFFRLYRVDGISMNYGVVEGDMILTLRKFSKISRGDMLVVRHPEDPQNRLYLKRCVAVAGDSFFEKGRFFYLQIESNSQKTFHLARKYHLKYIKTEHGYFLEEPFKKYYGVVHDWYLKVPHELRSLPLMKVPQNHYFVMGDFRDNSADSRFFGAVPREWVMSKVILVVKRPRAWLELIAIKEAD